MALPAIGDGEQIGDGNLNETLIVGRATQPIKIQNSASGTLSFFGTAVVAQPSGAAQAAVATDAATTGAATYGFTSAQANGMVATVNAIRTALVNLGLIKGS